MVVSFIRQQDGSLSILNGLKHLGMINNIPDWKPLQSGNPVHQHFTRRPDPHRLFEPSFQIRLYFPQLGRSLTVPVVHLFIN